MTRLSLGAVVKVFIAAICLCGIPSATVFARPPVQVKVNFDSTDFIAHATGNSTYQATPAPLTASERAAILAKAQEKYDQALGPGKVVLSEGTGGDIDIVMSGATNPPSQNCYGNAGEACKPGVVYTGRFINEGFTGTGRTNAIGETLAHEIAHKLGVNYHYTDLQGALMYHGRGLSPALRAADQRLFRPADAEIMNKNLANACNDPSFVGPPELVQPPSAFAEAAPAGTEGPGGYAPGMLGDDSGFDADLLYEGPDESEFGYISASGDFVYQGNGVAPDQRMGFNYELPYDFAVRLNDGTIISISDPNSHTFQLLDPYPDRPNRFQTLIEQFFTPQGLATVTLTVDDPLHGGGFVRYVPEPGSFASVAFLALIGSALLRRKRA